MDTRQAHKRILAAQTLLLQPTTTREKFTHIRSLIEGINPKVDEVLKQVDESISTVEKVLGGQVIQLGAEHLPENTEEEKKRKRALLLFLNTWKKLKSEVARVEQELEAGEQAQGPAEQVSMWGRIFSFAKGPLGIITILIVGAVVALQTTSVEISIKNQGCGTMQVSTSVPDFIPGISLPTDPIKSGDTALAKLPPLTFSVDGTAKGVVTLKALSFTLTFGLPNNISDVTMNGVSLLGKKSEVKLSERAEHTLVLACR